jgi:hypothetical protein
MKADSNLTYLPSSSFIKMDGRMIPVTLGEWEGKWSLSNLPAIVSGNWNNIIWQSVDITALHRIPKPPRIL